MRPGTFHMVLTLEDSVSTGGMFYNPVCYDRTAMALLSTHLHGMRVSNLSYPGGQLVLFELFLHYIATLTTEKFYSEPECFCPCESTVFTMLSADDDVCTRYLGEQLSIGEYNHYS
jgi:hypothetical protein